MKRSLLPLVIAALAIGLTVLLMWPARKTSHDPRTSKYMYCSACERDWAYKADLFDAGCPRCSRPLEGTVESIKTTGARPNPYSRMIAAVGLELVAAMIAVVLLSKPRHEEEEIEYIYMQCPKCRQRIRYQEKQIGNSAACRRCKQSFVYPEVDPNAEDEPA